MSLLTPARRRASRRRAAGLAGTVAATVLALGLQVTPAGAVGRAGARPASPAPSVTVNPYSPAYRHPYRHGVVPTLTQQAKMTAWARRHLGLPADSASDVAFNGGQRGVGVTTGQPKVYLVFYGSQWGTQGTDSRRDLTLTGDRSGEAPYLQRLYQGLGTDGESWSGIATQYCEGVAFAAESCPADSLHVQYPAKDVLAGIWVDEQTAAPRQATGHQLAVEAIRAAGHFGNTTAGSNRNSQYVILSPTGTHPDGFNTPTGLFCGWHDWNGDGMLSGGYAKSHYGPIAFTNLPYLPDDPVICGANFVNPGKAGRLDGVSIVAGHEYIETLTDQLPFGGWVNFQGSEAADLCAWNVGPGAPAADVKLATGSFAMQPIWSNDADGGTGICEMSHRIVRNLGIFNGGFETGTFQGWTTSGAASIVSTGQHTGRFAARIGRRFAATAASSIAQTFNASGRKLSFWYAQTCHRNVRSSWATATLTDNTADRTVRILARSCVRRSGWRKLSSALIVGHSYTLTLINHGGRAAKSGAVHAPAAKTSHGSYLLIDAVSIS